MSNGSNLSTRICREGGQMDRVRVSVDLLLDSTLTASAKVVWMALHLYSVTTWRGRPSVTRLAALTRLSRPTVRKGLTTLVAAGWYRLPAQQPRSSEGAQRSSPERRTSTPQGRSSTRREGWTQTRMHVGQAQRWYRRDVWIPRELLEDRRIKPQAVVMYGVLQTTPGFRFPNGKYTCEQLRKLTGRAPKTIRRAMNLLTSCGWLVRARKNHLYPFTFTVKNPVHEECVAELARVKKRLNRAKFIGEELMKEYLSLITDLDDFQDNATPGFLVNPFTDERMELDRYYPGRAAFEFNGPQHYQVTKLSTEKEVDRQYIRDKVKEWICERRGIRLVVVHAEDLTLKTMIEKVGTCLPLRDLRNRRLIIRHLETVSWRYRRAARRGQEQHSLTVRTAASAEG